MSPADSEDLRCAVRTRAAGFDPIGTAGTHDGYVLVEWPLPWPGDLGDVAELDAVRRAVRAARSDPDLGRLRIQGLVPATSDHLDLVIYRRPPAPATTAGGAGALFAGYGRSTARVVRHDPVADGAALAAALTELLSGPAPEVDPGVGDVLVCTHGRRDRCCGSLGTRLALALADQPPTGVTVRSTSHTGGHRFAPTVIVLPAGTVWGFADPGGVRRVVDGASPTDGLLDGYRGCAGLASPAVQVLERAVLGLHGWAPGRHPTQGRDLGGGRVELTVDGPDGTEVWTASVGPGRSVRLAPCGEAPGTADAVDTELALTSPLTRA